MARHFAARKQQAGATGSQAADRPPARPTANRPLPPVRSPPGAVASTSPVLGGMSPVAARERHDGAIPVFPAPGAGAGRLPGPLLRPARGRSRNAMRCCRPWLGVGGPVPRSQPAWPLFPARPRPAPPKLARVRPLTNRYARPPPESSIFCACAFGSALPPNTVSAR